MFKVGDLVKLKSGSPLMTIRTVNQDGWVKAVWFESGCFKLEEFRFEMLDKQN